MHKTGWICLLLLLSQMLLTVRAEVIEVTDDTGATVRVMQPVQRVVSLSPHVTELLYSSGATHQVVAAVDYSDYPEQAKHLTRVGSGYQLDIEAIVALQPDLVVGWRSGNQSAQLEQLKKLGLVLYLSEPENLQGIAKNLRDIGKLLGTSANADPVAKKLLQGIQQLQQKYQDRQRLKVFYQVWQSPLFTVNGKHIISQIIELCGGENVFSGLAILSPQVDVESVIAATPDVIVVGLAEGRGGWLQDWQKWTTIPAVKNKQLYGIEADLIVRHTPRILQGATLMCEAIEKARHH